MKSSRSIPDDNPNSALAAEIRVSRRRISPTRKLVALLGGSCIIATRRTTRSSLFAALRRVSSRCWCSSRGVPGLILIRDRIVGGALSRAYIFRALPLRLAQTKSLHGESLSESLSKRCLLKDVRKYCIRSANTLMQASPP